MEKYGYNQGNLKAASTGGNYNFIGNRKEIPTMTPAIGDVMGGEGNPQAAAMAKNAGIHANAGKPRTQEAIFNDIASGKVAL